MATKDQDKLTSIKCVTNPQHNTPDKTVAMTMLKSRRTILLFIRVAIEYWNTIKSSGVFMQKVITIGD